MIWKEIPGFPDYEVSENGDVRHGAKYLKPERVHGNGRKRFGLSREGRVFRFKAHQLVALAFIGPKPFKRAEVCHKDGFLHNNHYSNLRWGTSKSNVADTHKHRIQLREHSGLHVGKAQRLRAVTSEFLAQASRRPG